MKCNGCGAELPYDAYGNIQCPYCSAQNYVPIPKVVENNKDPVKVEVQTHAEEKKPSKLWYLAPILFALIGGVVAYVVLRNRDKKMAENLLLVGVAMFLIFLFFI